jgi:hypothetical protein
MKNRARGPGSVLAGECRRQLRSARDARVDDELLDMSLLDVVPDEPVLEPEVELGELVVPLLVVLGDVVLLLDGEVVVVVVVLVDGEVELMPPDVVELLLGAVVELLLGDVVELVLGDVVELLGDVVELLLGDVVVDPCADVDPVAPVPDVPAVEPELLERVSEEPLEVEPEPCDALVPWSPVEPEVPDVWAYATPMTAAIAARVKLFGNLLIWRSPVAK